MADQNPPKLSQIGVPSWDVDIDRMAKAQFVEYPIFACVTLAKAVVELKKRIEALEKGNGSRPA